MRKRWLPREVHPDPGDPVGAGQDIGSEENTEVRRRAAESSDHSILVD